MCPYPLYVKYWRWEGGILAHRLCVEGLLLLGLSFEFSIHNSFFLSAWSALLTLTGAGVLLVSSTWDFSSFYIVLSNDLTSYLISVCQSLLIPSNKTGLYGGLPNHRFMGLFPRLQTAYKEYMYAFRSISSNVLILLVAAWTLILLLFMLFKNWSTVISSRPDEFKYCNTSARKRSASTHVHISSLLFLLRAHNCPVYFRGEVFGCTYMQICSLLFLWHSRTILSMPRWDLLVEITYPQNHISKIRSSLSGQQCVLLTQYRVD